MALTPEQQAEFEQRWERAVGPEPLPKPKVVAVEGEAVRDADVHVSRADPNAGGTDQVVSVRRRDWVTVNLVEYARQRADREAERAHARSLDPYKLGLYGRVPFSQWSGPVDEDDL